MKLALYNLKGGVGKTSLSLNLALSLDFGIITNDVYSPIENVLPKEKLLKMDPNEDIPEVPNDYNVIYDFGGYLDPRVIKGLESADYVLLPIICNVLNIQVSINTIEEISKFNNNIIIVANKTQLDDFKLIKTALKSVGYEYPIFEIKQSKALDAVFEKKQSIQDMVNEGGLRAYTYKTINKQFNTLINFLKDKKNGSIAA